MALGGVKRLSLFTLSPSRADSNGDKSLDFVADPTVTGKSNRRGATLRLYLLLELGRNFP